VSEKSVVRRLLGSLGLVVFTGALVVGVVPGCGLENSLVGGACKTGYTPCGSDCVDVLTDPSHCGRCDATCASGVACSAGNCGGSFDASRDAVGDVGSSDASDGSATDSSSDGSASDASDASGDGSTSDASDASGDGSTSDASDASVDACPPPPYDNAATCGSCFVKCVAPNTDCLNVGGAFVCRPPCTPPLQACRGVCVDLQNDAFNCGVCDKICPSNLCVAGKCQGANPGHVVTIGHDYEGSVLNSSQSKLLTNSVLLPAANPLKILSFEKWANPSAVARIKLIVGAAALGRTLQYTVSNDEADLRNVLRLSQTSVVLVYDQAQLTAVDAPVIGAGWNAPLRTFAQEGGTIVALDGADGNGQMPALLQSAGLLDTASHTPLAPASRVAVVAPFDQVGLGAISPYVVLGRGVTFQSNEMNGGMVTFVARQGIAGGGDPVVVHKLVPPP
jgi:hypothetical protein